MSMPMLAGVGLLVVCCSSSSVAALMMGGGETLQMDPFVPKTPVKTDHRNANRSCQAKAALAALKADDGRAEVANMLNLVKPMLLPMLLLNGCGC